MYSESLICNGRLDIYIRGRILILIKSPATAKISVSQEEISWPYTIVIYIRCDFYGSFQWKRLPAKRSSMLSALSLTIRDP